VFGVAPHGTIARAARKKQVKMPTTQGISAMIPMRINPPLARRPTIVAERLTAAKRLVERVMPSLLSHAAAGGSFSQEATSAAGSFLCIRIRDGSVE